RCRSSCRCHRERVEAGEPQVMTVGQFAARAKRALRKPPRELAARAAGAIRARAQRPWSSVLPRVLSTRSLLRETGHRGIDDLWTSLASSPFFVSADRRASWSQVFEREYAAMRDRIVADAGRAL